MTSLKILLSLTLILITTSSDLQPQNKIVYLISPARCLSTVFLRSMHARGDFETMNDPALRAYWSAFWSDRLIKSRFKETAPKTFSELKQEILNKAKHTNVFVKDMSFSVENFLLHDHDFINKKNVHFVFLLRNPHHATISLYNASKHVRKTLPTKEAFSSLIGYKSSCNLFDHIKEKAINPPCILLAEDLYTNPRETLQTLCTFLKIPFKDEMLQWENLANASTLKGLHEYKNKDRVLHWHAAAMQSTGFKAPTAYSLDLSGQPSFAEIDDMLAREFYKNAYLELLPSYEHFFTEANAAFIVKNRTLLLPSFPRF